MVGGQDELVTVVNSRFASSTLSSSTRDLPVVWPCDFQKRIRHCAADQQPVDNFSRFSITSILSDTFAPPRIATQGRSGFVSPW